MFRILSVLAMCVLASPALAASRDERAFRVSIDDETVVYLARNGATLELPQQNESFAIKLRNGKVLRADSKDVSTIYAKLIKDPSGTHDVRFQIFFRDTRSATCFITWNAGQFDLACTEGVK